MAAENDSPFRTSISVPHYAVPIHRPARERRKTSKAKGSDGDDDEVPNPKLKFKLSGSGGGSSSHPIEEGVGVGWDRELDSDPDEPLVLEEHLILRVPPRVAPLLRTMVDRREIPPDVWFKFKDSRRAVFHLGDKLYGAKLVDLPTLLESQKTTGVGGQSVKVADISQMLLVEDEVQDEAEVTRDKAFNIEDFVYPHGITPPLKHVRKRRFRKRLNKRTIEIVETAVEAMLNKDAAADEVKYELVDDAGSDDEYGSQGQDQSQDVDMDSVGAPTPAQGDDGDDGDGLGPSERGDDEDEDDDDEGGFDAELAAEINKAMARRDASVSDDDGSGSGGGGLFGSSGGSDDDDDDEEEEEEATADPETLEQKKRVKLLAEETGDLERAILAKEAELAKATNLIFKRRFEDMIKKLTADRDLKRQQHAAAARDLEKKLEKAKEAEAPAKEAPPAAEPVAPVAPASAARDVGGDGGLAEEDEDQMDLT